MPLIDRDTIIDRPVLLDRSGNKEQEETEEQEEEVQPIGEGGGPTINGVEFEVGHYNIVAAANLASVLATGEDDGQSFKNVFRNAVVQLYELEQRGRDITSLSEFAARNNVDILGVQPRQAELLQGNVVQEPDAEGEDVNIDDIEEQISNDEQDTTEESEDGDTDEEVVSEEEDVKPAGTIRVGKKVSEEEDEAEDDEE